MFSNMLDHAIVSQQWGLKRAKCSRSLQPEAFLRSLLAELVKHDNTTVKQLHDGQPVGCDPQYLRIPITAVTHLFQHFWQQAKVQHQAQQAPSCGLLAFETYPLDSEEVFMHAVRAMWPQLTFPHHQGGCLMVNSEHGDHGIAWLLSHRPDLLAACPEEQQATSSSTSKATDSHATVPAINACSSFLSAVVPAAAGPADTGPPSAVVQSEAPCQLRTADTLAAASDSAAAGSRNVSTEVHVQPAMEADTHAEGMLLERTTSSTEAAVPKAEAGVSVPLTTDTSFQHRRQRHRTLCDNHVQGVRFMLDVEGRQENARAMWDKLQHARNISDVEDFRTLAEKSVHCRFCKRQLSFMCFQRKGEEVGTEGYPQVHCLAHYQPDDDDLYSIARVNDEDFKQLLAPYIEARHIKDLLAPAPLQQQNRQDIVRPLLEDTPRTVRANDADIGRNGTHIWHLDDFAQLLRDIGRPLLENGAETVLIDRDEDEKYAASDILVDQILAALKDNKYFNTNLCVDTNCLDSRPNRMSAQVQKWRNHEHMYHKAYMSTSKTSTTLVLAGKPGTFTDWHVDWAEAVNYCLLLVGLDDATTEQDVDEVAAVWWFLRPDSVCYAQQYLELMVKLVEDFSKKSFDEQAATPLTDSELELMQHFVQANGGCMVRVEQRPGDKVLVPAGWMHTVRNYKACVKVAWDFYDDRHWPQYFLASHHLLTITGQRNSEDYMDVEAALLATLKVERSKWIQQLLADAGCSA